MKKEKKISMMRLMMISSQLLLSLFLGYWLFSQYAEKRILLSEDLERGLRISEQQVIDTLLSTHLINPILSDSSVLSVFMSDSIGIDHEEGPVKMEMKLDSMPQMIMRFSGEHQNEIIKNTKVISSIAIADSPHQLRNNDMQTTLTLELDQDTSKQILFQGIKLLINSVDKIDADQNNIYTFFSTDVDTAMLENVFRNFIDKYDDGFNVFWQAIDAIDEAFIEKEDRAFPVLWQNVDKSIMVENTNNSIAIRSHLLKNLYGPIITGHRFYLIKSISPQIAFAFILLLITSLSFRMAYVNLNNQKKLINIKNNFISNITHELKTPVATVKVALEALLDFNMKEDPKRTKEYLEMAHSEMNRLDTLVYQVLNNSALEEGNSFVFPEEINLIMIVNEVLQRMQSRFDKQNAIVNFNPAREEILLKADKLHIHGVIVNLIDNSLKYTDQKPEITIQISEDDKETKLTISDNGIGISKEYEAKVFDKFFRVPIGDMHNVKGYGLGLNYAALVMENHQGKIDVKPNVEGGSSFSLHFPKNI